MNKITDKTTNKTMDKTTNKIANQITMLGTGNATISQINTDFLFCRISVRIVTSVGDFFCSTEYLCKSVKSVGLKKILNQ